MTPLKALKGNVWSITYFFTSCREDVHSVTWGLVYSNNVQCSMHLERIDFGSHCYLERTAEEFAGSRLGAKSSAITSLTLIPLVPTVPIK